MAANARQLQLNQILGQHRQG
jgi:Ca2+-binding EF-hand superfamily protein